jgi:hypothetical protein
MILKVFRKQHRGAMQEIRGLFDIRASNALEREARLNKPVDIEREGELFGILARCSHEYMLLPSDQNFESLWSELWLVIEQRPLLLQEKQFAQWQKSLSQMSQVVEVIVYKAITNHCEVIDHCALVQKALDEIGEQGHSFSC